MPIRLVIASILLRVFAASLSTGALGGVDEDGDVDGEEGVVGCDEPGGRASEANVLSAACAWCIAVRKSSAYYVKHAIAASDVHHTSFVMTLSPLDVL